MIRSVVGASSAEGNESGLRKYDPLKLTFIFVDERLLLASFEQQQQQQQKLSLLGILTKPTSSES